ncbi:hypothetical protein K435DRAFT_860011 [Dendrothele bispora CBS 962.96]|uniref:Uncharacterized protein n=1 Tax=Dendrothele bispora (strain CBS 962.96) TaxID=1314807 RepID=A0A4S8LZ59_DENBC|nr:hypothetical protein K435DRAFT_860011 [Dendrothele bispora CBS 962.96]
MSSLKHPHNKVGSVADGPLRNGLVRCTAYFSPKRMCDNIGDFYDHWRDVFLVTGSSLDLNVNSLLSLAIASAFTLRIWTLYHEISGIVDGTKITGIIDCGHGACGILP